MGSPGRSCQELMSSMANPPQVTPRSQQPVCSCTMEGQGEGKRTMALSLHHTQGSQARWDPRETPPWKQDLLRSCLCGVDLPPPAVPRERDKLLFPQPRVLIVVRPAAQSSLMNCNWKEVPL